MLLGVPIYQLLDDNCSLGHRNPQDRHQIPKHLSLPVVPKGAIVIGGGSGEHPAIALYDPVHCVARYLQYCLHLQPSKIGTDLEAACANMQGDLQTIEYCNWTSQNHLDFRKRCAGVYASYQDDLSFEGWLLAVVGEFLFHVVPTFNPQVQAWHQNYASDATCWFQIISIPYEPGSYGGNGRDRFRIVDTEPGASPNGGPASPLGNSGLGGGPPSVS
jgi:hypothetical protein